VPRQADSLVRAATVRFATGKLAIEG